MVLNDIYTVGETGIGAVREDITKIAYVEAVVNAAKNTLLGEDGVDGAVHRAAGPQLLQECKTLNGCETGKAKITGAYDMPCKYIIHTVGPVWQGGEHDEAELLVSCYKNSLRVAADNGVRTIAFSSISTGRSAYPIDEAAYIAVHAVIDFLKENPGTFVFVLWACTSDRTYAAYKRALEQASEEKDSEMYPGMVVVTTRLEFEDAMKNLDIDLDFEPEDIHSGYLS